MTQTKIQNINSMIAGSWALYVWSDFSSLQNIGAIRDLAFNHKAETSTITFDNVKEVEKEKNFDKASFSFKLAELDPNIWSLFHKGLINVDYVNWTVQSITDESLVADTTKVIRLINKNGDDTKDTNIVVKSSDWATTYTENTDYEIVVTPDGYTAFVLIDWGGIANGDTVLVSYDYTPITMKKISFESWWLAKTIVARLVHTENDWKTYEIDLYSVTNIKTVGIDFKGDNDDDIATMDIELEWYVKEIRDEVSIN